MAISKTFGSINSCWNSGVVDIHSRSVLVHHLFSSCVGLATQCSHLHQSGTFCGESGFGGGCSASTTISPLTISPKTARCLRRSSRASIPQYQGRQLNSEEYKSGPAGRGGDLGGGILIYPIFLP